MSPDAMFWLELATKMAVTAAFLVAATAIAERAGPLVGGLVATLPISAGPVYLFLALDHDARFIAASAMASLVANAVTGLFALVYILVAQVRGPLASLAVALGFWLTAIFTVRSFAWTLPGALFLLAAAWFGGAAHGPFAVRWLERLPGGGGLVLSIWNLVPALLVGLVAPLALLVPEPREKTPARAAFLLVLTAANLAAVLAVGPGVAVLGWFGGAWALYFLLGEADAANAGKDAVAPFVLHAFAAACVLLAALAPALLPLLLVAGAIRLGAPPAHGVTARTFALLPTGALLLVVVGFAATGLAAARDGVTALVTMAAAGGGAAWLGPLALVAAGATAWAGFVALAEGDLKRRLAGFVSAQGAL